MPHVAEAQIDPCQNIIAHSVLACCHSYSEHADSKVSLPLLGILLVAVIGLVLYLAGYVLAHFGIPVASIWIYVALALVPVCFLVLLDFSR